MMHIDIVAREHGRQVRRAHILERGLGVRIVPHEANPMQLSGVAQLVRQSMDVYPRACIFTAVHQCVQYPELFATAPHEHDDCMFLSSDVVEVA